MSQDASSLRNTLSRVDGSAPGIQGAASAMMKHYDRSATVAVNEWRNCLATCSLQQLLPLLYVANEVLQNSKRNRGNKFLEAMSPVLGPSLRHICSRDPNLTEKVRRTAKIWGDRRVFSIRYVNELLQELEDYRHGRRPPEPSAAKEQAAFSPQHEEEEKELPSAPEPHDSDSDDDDVRKIVEDKNRSSDDDDDDDDDIFASTGDQKLEVDFSSALAATADTTADANKKRRRSSMTSTGSSPSKRRSSATATVLSAASLLDLWTRLQELTTGFESAQQTLGRIDERHEKQPAAALEHLVGDELQQAHRRNESDAKDMAAERRRLHAIAQERKELEGRSLQYLPWLEKSLQQDQDDIEFCDMLEQKILSFQDIHQAMTVARNKRLAEERAKQQQEAERDRKKKEKEEQEMFRRAALSKETEAKPGMVWNPATREYQFPNTDESWRE